MAPRFRPSADTLATRVGEEIILVHLKTDKIFVLNRTGARVWELVCADLDLEEIELRVREEFVVPEGVAGAQISGLLRSLREEDLIETGRENQPSTRRSYR